MIRRAEHCLEIGTIFWPEPPVGKKENIADWLFGVGIYSEERAARHARSPLS
jgi:hypothetical protein